MYVHSCRFLESCIAFPQGVLWCVLGSVMVPCVVSPHTPPSLPAFCEDVPLMLHYMPQNEMNLAPWHPRVVALDSGLIVQKREASSPP